MAGCSHSAKNAMTCSPEAAVDTLALLRRLPVRWRALTLVVLQDLFGAALVSDGAMPEAASSLFRRVAPTPSLSQERASGI